MTITWTFGGTDLATFGKVTLINDYLDVPSRRGDNQLVPYRHGKVFVPKYYDERTLSFGIAIISADAATLETTFDTMRALFAVRTEQVLSCTREDSTVRTALASVNKSIQVNRITGSLAKIVVEFSLPNPIFRSDTILADNTTTINANPTAMTVDNIGSVEERDAIFTLTGPLSNTVITNSTTGQTLTYTGTIASPRVVTIQTAATGEYTATTDLGVNVIGNVTHSGSAALMTFNPGDNTLSIADATHTTGTIGISFYPPFL